MPQHRHLSIPIDTLQLHPKPPQTRHVLEHLQRVIRQRMALVLGMAQGEAAVAAQIHVPDLNIRLARAQVVLLR